MKYKTINSDKFNTPYSDAIEIGDIVEFSGMLGNTENGLVDGCFESELHQIFQNLRDGLDYYSLNLSNITKVKIFFIWMSDGPFAGVFIKFFKLLRIFRFKIFIYN